ncbi:MAG: TRAP transporter large permease subunit [Rhizobiales bacterium]|nr:TRAP transporter large permease subunit [Hyphomicrobiales bacterium]
MSELAILGIGLLVLVALFLSGLPVYLCFILLVGSSVIVIFGDAGFGMIANSIFDVGTTEALTTVPLYILMGEILMRSGSIDVLFASIDKLVGGIRGRQYHMTLTLSAILGAPAGSGIAVAAMLGRSVMPPMVRRGYDPGLTAGVMMGGALLAPIIPPSVLAIIIGTLADVSIADLLIAGIIPGIVLTFLYVGIVVWKVRRNPALAPDEVYVRPSRQEKLIALTKMIPFSLIIFVAVGLIMIDFATASEAAALGALAAFIESLCYRRMRFTDYLQAASDSAVLSAVILLIMASAILFGQILAFTGGIQELGAAIEQFKDHRWLVFILMMLLPFVLCMFVDQVGLMMVLIPIYEPLIKALDFDPVWFWMQFLINMVVGAITPPFGYIIFALKAAVPGMTLPQLYRPAWTFVLVTVFGIVVFAVFPDLVTFLPRALK